MLLKDKVILITGASKGLGRAMTVDFAKKGAKLAICSRNVHAIRLVQIEIERQEEWSFYSYS